MLKERTVEELLEALTPMCPNTSSGCIVVYLRYGLPRSSKQKATDNTSRSGALLLIIIGKPPEQPSLSPLSSSLEPGLSFS